MSEKVAEMSDAKPKPEVVADVKNKQKELFPDVLSAARLSRYTFFESLFMGDHYDAFNMQVSHGEYNKRYSMLRYLSVNFAGLISKVVADMLFSEPISVTAEGGDQEFIEALFSENNLHVQLYESALANSYNGDAVFKVRIGTREGVKTVIIEDITPRVYFPKINLSNARENPSTIELKWIVDKGSEKFLRKEIHKEGQVLSEAYMLDENVIGDKVELSLVSPNIQEVVNTGVKRLLVEHVPNWKTGSRHFGISDYYDLESLFFGLNNRMTMVDNILDKHSDPILAVPPGVIDENGKVKKKALGVVEVGDGMEGKPEYIVWDASLENAFKEIEKIVEFMYLIGEVSPDILGMGHGANDSGRALKFKLLRTVAKVARKKMYYDYALKRVLYTAQLLAKEHGLTVAGKKLSKEPVVPDVYWADGLPVDEVEQMDLETKSVDAGFTSPKESIKRIYGVNDETAEKLAKEARESRGVPVPSMNLGKNGTSLDDARRMMKQKEKEV